MSRTFFNSIATKVAISVMALLFIAIGVVSLFSYNEANAIFVSYNTKLLEHETENIKKRFILDIKQALKSIELLSFNEDLRGYMRAYYDPYGYDEQKNKTKKQYQQELQRLFYLFLKQNGSFYQIRLLDAKAQEVIKAIKIDSDVVFADNDALQNKAHRPYFQKISQLQHLYISPITLNREFHTIEYPIKPTLRIGVPIKQNKVMYLFVNINIAKLWNFQHLSHLLNTDTFLADERGYYLLNVKEPFKEFAFEYGKHYKILEDFPHIVDLYDGNNEKIWSDKEYIYVAKRIEYVPKRFVVLLQRQKKNIFIQKAQEYRSKLFALIGLLVVVLTFITAFLVYTLVRPIQKLSLVAKEIAKTKGAKRVRIDIKSRDEIGELARSFSMMLDALIHSQNRLKNFAKDLEKEVEKKTQELQQVNKNLQKLVEEKVEEIRKKDHVLAQQAKMAAMGEMLGAIAHQWRQPLNDLAINIQLLEDLYHQKRLDEEEIEHFVDKNMKTIKFMSDTIDDFRNFFRKDKEAVEFSIKEAVEQVVRLQKAQLSNHNIEVEIKGDARIRGYKNEFMQAVLNLISNAKDAILQHSKKGKITINIEQTADGAIVYVQDNGGGIPEEILPRLFEPYFTTKEEGHGTGMGLWMVKEIVDHFKGEIEVKNFDGGARFTMRLRNVDES